MTNMMLKWFGWQKNCVSLSMYLFIATSPHQDAIIVPLVKSYFLPVASTMDMDCSRPGSFILYDS